MGKNGHTHLEEGAWGAPVPAKNWDSEALAAADNDAGDDRQSQVTLWDRGPALHNYYEALRDRLIVDFEVRDLKHKPKLLAVTSCSRGAGVTTVACGLAACLSQTGDGKVLLVDMTQQNAAAQQFFNGRSVCGLDAALSDTNPPQLQDNLFVVTERTDSDNRSRNVARQLGHLMPKLRASSYDYIIFDMPPVSQTSITPRLAGFVDTVVLVIESEKTDRGLALQASTVLTESKAHVRVVLNKTQTYIPPQLHQEFLGES
jgi:Mrp family chromosome partitioning ATPase